MTPAPDPTPPDRTGPDPAAPPLGDRSKRLRCLVSQRCDAALTESQAAELESLVASDPMLLREYVGAVANESLLQQAFGLSVHAPGAPSSLSDAELNPDGTPREATHRPHNERSRATGRSGSPSAAVQPLPLSKHKGGGPSRGRGTSRGSLLAIAASLLVAVAVFAVVKGRPAARIVAASEAWLPSGSAAAVGARVGDKWIELERGSVDLAFRDGAMASIDGPAKFRALGGGRAELALGVATLYCPDGSQGFTVAVPGGAIVDLGTCFRLSVTDKGDTTAHVTRGSVRLEGLTDEPIALGTGEHGALSAAGAAQRSEPSRVRVAGDFEFVEQHPVSLGYNAFDRDGVANVFLESAGVRLAHDVRLDLAEVGRHTLLQSSEAVAPEGSVIDCYLIHCSPQSARHEVQGAVKFAGKIVGVIGGSDRLNATNPQLGARWTLQCAHPERGVESAPDRNSDLLTISPDRHTLGARFRTESIDQVRVLVEAE